MSDFGAFGTGYIDTITRCQECQKLVGAAWDKEMHRWRTYAHNARFRQRVPHVLPCIGGDKLLST